MRWVYDKALKRAEHFGIQVCVCSMALPSKERHPVLGHVGSFAGNPLLQAHLEHQCIRMEPHLEYKRPSRLSYTMCLCRG